jgi:hypothetical protein
MSEELSQLLAKEGHLVVLTWTADDLQTYFKSHGQELNLERAAELLKAAGPWLVSVMLLAAVRHFRKILENEMTQINEAVASKTDTSDEGDEDNVHD